MTKTLSSLTASSYLVPYQPLSYKGLFNVSVRWNASIPFRTPQTPNTANAALPPISTTIGATATATPSCQDECAGADCALP